MIVTALPTPAERFTSAITHMKRAIATYDEVASAEPGPDYGPWAQETLFEAQTDLRDARNQMVIGVDLLQRTRPDQYRVASKIDDSIDTLDELRTALDEMDLSLDLAAELKRPMDDARNGARLLANA